MPNPVNRPSVRSDVAHLPVLRKPQRGDEDWDDKTGPMSVYHGRVEPARVRPIMRKVDLSLRDATWAAQLVELAVRNLGSYLSGPDTARAEAIARKLRGEV